MTRNEHNIDRILRIALGIVVIGAGLAAQSWFGALGLIFLVTGLIGFCPIYRIFGISTCPVENRS